MKLTKRLYKQIAYYIYNYIQDKFYYIAACVNIKFQRADNIVSGLLAFIGAVQEGPS